MRTIMLVNLGGVDLNEDNMLVNLAIIYMPI
jgi:hypothetical protein